MESMGVVSGCGCKEVYRFPHIIIPILVSALFCSSIPTFCSFLKCFSFLFQYFFVTYVIISSRIINTHTDDYGRPTEAVWLQIMFYKRRSTHKRMLHILRWTLAVCLQGAGCRSRCRGRALYSAFGSVSHKYILDILSHIKAPLQLQQYIKNLYSSLSAYIYTKEWSTPTFPIKRVVFQGDTLSPLLFLIAFNPILQALCIHPTKGFSLLIEKEAQVPPTAIPKTGSYVYALWNEYPSDEKHGFYLAKVCSVSDEGETVLQYRAGGRIEKVTISEICWVPAKGNGKWFLPPSTTLPSIPMTPAKLSKEHKVKAYADDLTIITENPVDHQLVLSFANDK